MLCAERQIALVIAATTFIINPTPNSLLIVHTQVICFIWRNGETQIHIINAITLILKNRSDDQSYLLLFLNQSYRSMAKFAKTKDFNI